MLPEQPILRLTVEAAAKTAGESGAGSGRGMSGARAGRWTSCRQTIGGFVQLVRPLCRHLRQGCQWSHRCR